MKSGLADLADLSAGADEAVLSSSDFDAECKKFDIAHIRLVPFFPRPFLPDASAENHEIMVNINRRARSQPAAASAAAASSACCCARRSRCTSSFRGRPRTRPVLSTGEKQTTIVARALLGSSKDSHLHALACSKQSAGESTTC